MKRLYKERLHREKLYRKRLYKGILYGKKLNKGETILYMKKLYEEN